MICVWPRVKSPEPCVRGLTATSQVDRADLLLGAAVGTTLVDCDLLADEVLVDRPRRVLDVAARERSFTLAVGRMPTGNGSLTVSTIRS